MICSVCGQEGATDVGDTVPVFRHIYCDGILMRRFMDKRMAIRAAERKKKAK